MANTGEDLDITPRHIEDDQDVITGMDFVIDMAEFRGRHFGQGVLDLEDVMVSV
ncbi:MAG: hypothetical protein V4678_01365 [Patescibacteria group bacterium]